MLRGQVEVIREHAGAPLATLGPREVFGERALLEDTVRNATVRAATAVDVLVMSRADFAQLVENLPPLGDYFDGLLRERAAPWSQSA
jgi:CRP-like cAMP-binding protein